VKAFADVLKRRRVDRASNSSQYRLSTGARAVPSPVKQTIVKSTGQCVSAKLPGRCDANARAGYKP